MLGVRWGLAGQTPPTTKTENHRQPFTSGELIVPLEYSGRHLYTTLKDERFGTVTLLVDTGFERTVIAKSVAGDRVATSAWRRKDSVSGFGTSAVKRKHETTDVSLHFKKDLLLKGSALVVDLTDVTKHLEHSIDGVLGWDFFRRWCATLDFASRIMKVRLPSDCEPPPATFSTLKGEWSSRGLMLRSVVKFPNGRSREALLHLDTGSDDTLFLNSQFRTTAGLEEAGTGLTGWGMNGTFSSDLTSLSSLDIEDGELHMEASKDTTIVIGRRGSVTQAHWWSHGFGQANINRDGVIGNGFLERMRLTFDSSRKRLYVVPVPEIE